MSTRIVVAVAAIISVVSLSAQQRAPQNDSIREAELRADLFFLAGDAMRGRLTDTLENRATADYIRSRFERIGLKPAAPGNSYFQSYNLMTATLAEGNSIEVGSGDGPSAACSTGRNSIRNGSRQAVMSRDRWCLLALASPRRAGPTTTTTAT